MAFSSSKATTSSSTSNTVNTTNKNLTAGDGAIVAGEGASIQITDGGAINRSFDAVELIADRQADITKDAFQLSRDNSEMFSVMAARNAETVASFARDALDKQSETTGLALDRVQRAQGVDTSTLASESNKNASYIMFAGAAVAAIVLLKK